MSDDTSATDAAQSEEEGAPSGHDDNAGAGIRFGAIVEESLGDTVLHASVEQYLHTATAAHADGFALLVDLTAVDFLTYAGTRTLPDAVSAERFEVVTSLFNPQRRERIRIRVQVSAADAAVASMFDLWPGSELLEREVYDLFGIEFTDHPDMCRVLMPDDWVGHPLRKDYAVSSIPVQFKAASNIR